MPHHLPVRTNFKLALSIFAIVFLCLSVYGKVQASATEKTITVHFASTPSSYSVTKLPLKYGKDFAYSWTFDDGYIEGYRNAFRYFNGGRVDADGVTYPGRYSTDGAGNLVAFNGSFALNLVNTSFVDTHYDTTSSFSYREMRDAYDGGWDLLNQGWQGIGTPSPSNTVINYPAPHGASTIDYAYEMTQLNDVVKDKINIPYNTTVMTLPSGEQNYIDAALGLAYVKSILSQATIYNFTGGPYTIPTGSNPIDVNNLISSPTGLTDYFMYRNLVNSPSTTPDTTNVSSYATLVDSMANTSGSGVNKWGHIFTHRVWCGTTTCGTVGSISGANMYWPKWKELIDYVYTNYGAGGDDSIWVAGQEEVYQYLETLKATDVSTSLNGSTLTITLDTTDVPTDIRRRALSLMVDADVDIASIEYGSGDFTYTTQNTTTGLINLEMGEYYLTNLNSKVEAHVATAEASLIPADVTTAQTWIDFLSSGATKTAFQARVNAIPTPDRVFQLAVGQNANGTSTSIGGMWNKHSKISTVDAAITLVDTASVTSAITWKVQSNFNSKFDGSTNSKGSIAINNTGVFPDTYIKQGVLITTNGATGTFRLSGLNPAKLYNFKMMGSTVGRNDRYDSKTKATYQATGLTSDSATLQVFQNINDFVILEDVAPTAGGLIDIQVTQYDTSNGTAILSALTMTEIDPAPVITFTVDDNTLLEGESTSLNWSATHTTACSANWTVSTSASGVQSISPTSTTSYSISCVGTGGTTTGTLSVTVNSNLALLTSAIASAQAVHDAAIEGTAVGEYPAGSKATLLSAITAASAIVNTESQSVVDTAVTTLNTAVTTFEAGVITFVASDLTALTSAIASAQAVHDVAVEGTALGQYPVGSKSVLLSAITTASAILDTQAQSVVDTAVTTLNTAVTIFEAGVITFVAPPPSTQSSARSGSVSTARALQNMITATIPTPVVSEKNLTPQKKISSVNVVGLRLRQTPNGKIIKVLALNQHVEILEKKTMNTLVWSLIKLSEKENGWVADKYLKEVESKVNDQKTNMITTSASILNVRKIPNGIILFKVPKGTKGTLIESKDDVWVKVQFDNGREGYVYKKYTY